MLYIDVDKNEAFGTAKVSDIKKFGLFEASRKNGN